ncbi:hypothetical protein LU631_07400 [Erwinia tracheiphila]|uniref:Uncharacterized protein n=1 Tax=Erwinia tracheiphila TaxID=65700 RepID=A0A0M2KL06_9GAMM|nr:hypothetical protein [Erwinia tracheiphila]EOS93058.1 hypothetical protein ETR_21092 [Erwinia tracheiphila PSU-1]KKF37686.1 hypothetical protein SY86_23435 [Erwinia tracheiphila]UIA89082.1 hypothetical protein LU631_07400 [Erwinia tracheiphila]UIA97465.1 hypothetical protein LU633_06080 [Erwinia tracheiphila]
MKISEEALLHAGFSAADLRKIRNNTESYGGTLGEAIQDLANRFIIAAGVIGCCLAVFVLLLFFGSEQSLFSGSIGLSCGIAVAVFVQPPILAWKSWRYRRRNRDY